MLECMHLYLHAYNLTAINSVTRNTAIHTFHIIGIYPGTNMPTTLHIFVPLHYYCTLHTDCTYKFKKKNFQLLTMFLPNMCQEEAFPWNATYMPHMKNSSYADTRQLYQYIYLIWVQWNQKWDQSWHTSMESHACVIHATCQLHVPFCF